MANKKYQVFVSSTFIDLKVERQAVISTILDLRHIPAGMELFPASDIDQFEYIKRIIDECDYYVLILANRYGSLGKEGISYTEQEYDYACKTGKFVLAFLHADPESLPMSKSDRNSEAQQALDSFRAKVRSGRLVSEWSDHKDLQVAVLKALSAAFHDHPQIGWLRGDTVATDDLINKNNLLLENNANLVAENSHLKELKNTSSLNLVDISSITTIKYTTRSYNIRLRKDETSYKELEISWHDFFLVFAPFLTTSKTDRIFEAAIKELRRSPGTYSLTTQQKAVLRSGSGNLHS